MTIDKQRATIRRSCFDSALRLLFKHDSPSDEQVYHHLCTQNHCPTGHCTYLFGFKEGRNCEYVTATKIIIGRLLSFRNGD